MMPFIDHRPDAGPAADSSHHELAALRAALDMHAIYSEADRSGRMIDMNTGFTRISGYSREELLVCRCDLDPSAGGAYGYTPHHARRRVKNGISGAIAHYEGATRTFEVR